MGRRNLRPRPPKSVLTAREAAALDAAVVGESGREAAAQAGIKVDSMKKRRQRARKFLLTRPEGDAQRDLYRRALERRGGKPVRFRTVPLSFVTNI